MPELAAHLERVAREIAHKHICGTCTDSVPCDVRGKAEFKDWELCDRCARRIADLAKDLAAALAACARETKLEEAKWWEAGKHTMSGHKISGTCPACERMKALGERAVGEKV